MTLRIPASSLLAKACRAVGMDCPDWWTTPFRTELLIWAMILLVVLLDLVLYFVTGQAHTISEAMRASPRWAAFAMLYGALGWHLFGPR